MAQPLRDEFGEPADQPEAAVTVQQIDLFARSSDVGHELGCRVLLRQIDRHRPGIAQLFRQLVEPILAPRHEHQPVATLRQLARELDAKPGGRAGDERDLLQAQDTVALTILPGSRGGSPTGSASTYSIPLSTWPQTVYCPSRKPASPKQMKNWLLALFGSGVRAIDAVPRTCGSRLNSAFRFGRSEPLVPVPVGSPPWAMKPGITRWKGTLS